MAVAAGDVGNGDERNYRVNGKPARGWGRVREIFQGSDSRKQSRKEKAKSSWEQAIRDFRPDLIWIHNLEGGHKWGWTLELVEQALAAAPVLWTLHDLWALGDGPSYFPENELRQRRPGSPLAKLQRGIVEGRCILLAPSVWLRDLVRKSGTERCEVWPTPLDPAKFHPDPRERTRKELGLKNGETLLLAAAENLADPRKGIDLLQECWQSLGQREGIRLGLIGRNCPAGLGKRPGVLVFGPVREERRMAELMAAADLFVHPAKVESFGLVLEEAQACGTPVVAFEGGGVGETLEKGVSGWILPKRSAGALAQALEEILAQRQNLPLMRARCRACMVQKHGAEAFLTRWAEIRARAISPQTYPSHG